MAVQADKYDQDIHRPSQVPAGQIAPDAPAEDARQGRKLGVMRWVLTISLALVIAAFLLAYFLSV